MADCPECNKTLGTEYGQPINCKCCWGFIGGMQEERRGVIECLLAHGWDDLAQMIEQDGADRDEQLKRKRRRRTGNIRRKRRGEPDRRKGG